MAHGEAVHCNNTWSDHSGVAVRLRGVAGAAQPGVSDNAANSSPDNAATSSRRNAAIRDLTWRGHISASCLRAPMKRPTVFPVLRSNNTLKWAISLSDGLFLNSCKRFPKVAIGHSPVA